MLRDLTHKELEELARSLPRMTQMPPPRFVEQYGAPLAIIGGFVVVAFMLWAAPRAPRWAAVGLSWVRSRGRLDWAVTLAGAVAALLIGYAMRVEYRGLGFGAWLVRLDGSAGWWFFGGAILSLVLTSMSRRTG